jgi:hypothetical protein
MNKSAFILISALFFLLIAFSLKAHLLRNDCPGNAIPIHLSYSISKPDALTPERTCHIFISWFKLISTPPPTPSYYAPPINTNYGAVKIPKCKYLRTNISLKYLLPTIVRSNSDSDPLPA